MTENVRQCTHRLLALRRMTVASLMGCEYVYYEYGHRIGNRIERRLEIACQVASGHDLRDLV